MCLLLVAWRERQDYPLVVAANRDEFHQRPTAPLQWWQDAPALAAGRDLEAGGTWLGVTRGGRFAALTNVRDPAAPTGRRSRGLLVRDVLLGDDSVAGTMQQLVASAEDYAPFNLLAGDRDGLFYMNNMDGEAPQALPPGIHGLSNATLNTPWPKVVRGREAMTRQLAAGPDEEALLALLAEATPAADEDLPDTGVGRELERYLSPLFIRGEGYGTRCSTVVMMAAGGEARICERRYDADGRAVGTARLDFTIVESVE